MNTGVILLVEDNPADVRLTMEALKENHASNRLSVARDGVEALAFLRRTGSYAGAPRPELVLLDLNLPGKDGLEVLAEMKEDPELKSIPVVVLTTSDNPKDIVKSYQLHANSYITKSLRLEQFIKDMEAVVDFWLDAARLPAKEPGSSLTVLARSETLS
jgi:chemotaxis family two-component system response regulator Rcp1